METDIKEKSKMIVLRMIVLRMIVLRMIVLRMFSKSNR